MDTLISETPASCGDLNKYKMKVELALAKLVKLKQNPEKLPRKPWLKRLLTRFILWFILGLFYELKNLCNQKLLRKNILKSWKSKESKIFKIKISLKLRFYLNFLAG